MDRQACFAKGFGSLVKKGIVLEEDSAFARKYVLEQYNSLMAAIESKNAHDIYDIVEDDKGMREFYRVITGDSIEETGKKTLMQKLHETFVTVENPIL